jgi:acyl dehydratase
MHSTEHSAVPSAPVTLAHGAELEPFTIGPISRTDIVRYAGAGGDFNPIHHDEPFARSAGCETVFAMGFLHAGMLGQRLARWVGPDNIRAFAVRFTGQVWPGDELTFTGRVQRIEDEVDSRLAYLELEITRQTAEQVLRATATVRVA